VAGVLARPLVPILPHPLKLIFQTNLWHARSKL
jgi:hypothetical protein